MKEPHLCREDVALLRAVTALALWRSVYDESRYALHVAVELVEELSSCFEKCRGVSGRVELLRAGQEGT